MQLVKEAVKNLKLVFKGDVGSKNRVLTQTDHFPDLATVKKSLEAVIGISLSADTTNATATEMTVFKSGNSSAMLLVPASTAIAFKIMIVASELATGDCAKFNVAGLIKQDDDGDTTLVGLDVEDNLKDTGAAAWTVTVVADDTKDALSIKVKGEASKTIAWKGYIEYQLVK